MHVSEIAKTTTIDEAVLVTIEYYFSLAADPARNHTALTTTTIADKNPLWFQITVQ
jgi:hypothetical protein